MIKILLIILSLFVSTSQIFSQHYPHLDKKIKELRKSKTLQHGQWSVYAEYVKSGKVIVSLNSEESLAPASGLKVFTTSIALNTLGEEYRYKTKLYYDGTISKDGTLDGNIYISGGGDPTLGSNLVNGSLPLDSLMINWVNAIKGKGIKKIQGGVYASPFFFDGKRVPDFWNWVDIGNYYGAGTSSLTINDNLYYLYFKPSQKVGEIAEVLRTEPVIPGLKFINRMKTGKPGSGDKGYIYCAPSQFTATLRGSIPAGVNEFSIKGSIPDPPRFSAQYLKSALIENNIPVAKVAGTLKNPVMADESKNITTTFSPLLKDIVYVTNKRSVNLYAETLLKTIARKMTGTGSTSEGTKFIKHYLDSVGVSTAGFKIYDGSGLSRVDEITTKAMTELLIYMTKQKTFDSFYNSLAVAGLSTDPGFFSNYGKDTPIADNARIKSGLITGVRSESGYLKDRKGRLIAFSMIANNYSGKYKQVDEIHKKVMILLAELK